MQNVYQKCKMTVAEFHFIILRRFGVIEENVQGGRGQIKIKIGLTNKNQALIE